MANEAHTGVIDLVDLELGRVAEVLIDPPFVATATCNARPADVFARISALLSLAA